eukprot:2417110-Pyramimonas_sp.AAC.1
MSACYHTTARSRSRSRVPEEMRTVRFNKSCQSMRSASTYKENGAGARVRSIDALRLYIQGKRYRRSRAKPWPRN